MRSFACQKATSDNVQLYILKYTCTPTNLQQTGGKGGVGE